MIMDVATNRRVKVITAYGKTKAFRPECGIEQGEVNAPIFWKVFYDPLLTKLAQTPAGYTLERAAPPSKPTMSSRPAIASLPGARMTAPLLEVPFEDFRVNNLAFVDDLT